MQSSALLASLAVLKHVVVQIVAPGSCVRVCYAVSCKWLCRCF